MSFGISGTDFEEKINFDRLRKERLERAKEHVKKYNLGALLCFDFDNIRYITGTHIGEWARNKMQRYTILPVDSDPILFDPAMMAKKKTCPWIADRVFPAVGSMRGSIPPEAGMIEKVANSIVEVLKQYKVADLPLGVDIIEVPLIEALTRRGITVVDGQQAMLDARIIKTKEEIELLTIAASMVDATYAEISRILKPGLKESDIVALVNNILYTLGSEFVECVNVVSGPRGIPHPHVFSDRIIRPGDLVFIDIMHSYNGYRTCYYRTFVVGEPTGAQIEAYERAWKWLKDSMNAVKPKATTADIAKCWPAAEDLGFKNEEEAFLLQFGHGVGLSIWEKPVISRLISLKHPFEIHDNMVFALETWCPSRDGKGAARIEEEVVVTEFGYERLFRFPAEKLISCPTT